MNIEPARPEDLPQLVGLLNELFNIELDFTPDASRQQRGLELMLAEVEKSGNAMVMVARDENGKAIGMASAQLVISTAEGAPSAWIEDVIVHCDHRRQGVGRELLDCLLTWARSRGATRAQLVMDADNASAELLYNGLGWENTQLKLRRRFIR